MWVSLKYKSFIAKCDGIVIGCTSYSLAKPIIAQEFKLKYNLFPIVA